MGQSQSSLVNVIPTWEIPPDGAEKEPMLLLDTTGSMTHGTSQDDKTPRKDTVREAISIIVQKLGAEDSQAENEEHGGGLRTVTFAGGRAKDLDDINPKNLKEKWEKIRWEGSTFIIPGWLKILQAYKEEFGKREVNSRPILMLLVITDGEATDSEEFARALKNLKGGVYVTFAIIGYGPDHDKCMESYKQIANENPHVKILAFDSESNPEIIARGLLKMLE